MILFQSDTVSMPSIDEVRLRAWIRATAASYGMTVGNLNYVFCNDEEELKVNRQFLNHDFYTDVITFDYSVHNVLNGDIFISIDMVKHNAEENGANFEDELKRIIIHGLLHLTGQGDKTPETKVEMTRKEDLALSQY